MSGRRLGRLLGSLLVVASLLGGVAGVDFDSSMGSAQTLDLIWQ